MDIIACKILCLVAIIALASTQDLCNEFNLNPRYTHCAGTVGQLIKDSECREDKLLTSLEVVKNCFQGCTNNVSQTFYRRLMDFTATAMTDKCVVEKNNRTGRYVPFACDIKTVENCVTGLQVFLMPITSNISSLNRFCGAAYMHKPQETTGNCTRAVESCRSVFELLPDLFFQINDILKVTNETLDNVCDCASFIKIAADRFGNSGPDCENYETAADIVTAVTNECIFKLRFGITRFNWAYITHQYLDPYRLSVPPGCPVEFSFIEYNKASSQKSSVLYIFVLFIFSIFNFRQ